MLKRYRKTLENNKIKLPVNLWILIAVIFGVVLFFLIYLFFQNIILGIVFGLSIIDLVIGFPIYIERKKIIEIEKRLPDALREMADILKSGGTYEYALHELVTLDLGPLTKEFEKVLIRLDEGSNFEDAMRFLAEDVDSELLRKVVGIIIDSIRAGSGLADVLDEISEDSREFFRLNQERRAKTTMQVLFIFSAGALIAPAIFGLVMTIVGFLIQISAQTGIATKEVIKTAFEARSSISMSLLLYLFFEGIASSFMISLMRDKSLSRVLLYVPVLLLISYGTYYLSMFVAKTLLISMI